MGKAEFGDDKRLPSSLDKELRYLLLYARVGTLAMLANYYPRDGVKYQEIKGILALEDGSLGPNLLWLREKGYVEAKEEKFEGRPISVYYLTESGDKAYVRLRQWLETLLHPDNIDAKK